ncbi:MAG: peptidylprolyl isomerase [Candidatus Omnitrophica bacterium]|nr:peptidylprolyl isomerase [Candidatus Omnitrophota bacterium]
MKNSLGHFCALIMIVALLLSSGCGSKKEEVVVATIGDEKVTLTDFNERIDNLPARYRVAVRRRKQEYMNDLINDILLYQEAVRKNLHKDEEVQKVIVEARKKILIARLLKDEVDSAINITPEEMEDFYNSNRDRYMTPEILRVSHILVPTYEQAEIITKELDGGVSFEAVARAKSVDPTAQQGGDVGYFPKGQLMTEFDNACSQLEVGQISGPVKTKLGYHIIKLTDRKPPELRPIEQVSQDVEARLRIKKRQVIFNELLERLRGETVIVINEEVMAPSAGAAESEKEQ